MKKYLKYFLLFICFFISLIFSYSSFRMDTYINYGFSYNLVNGSVPYQDYNMIVPIFGPFLYSIGMIFNSSIITLYLEQAFLLTIFSYFIFQLLKEKAWIFLLILILPFPIPFPYCLYPGYNFLFFFLMIILIYLQEYKKSDKLIGFISGVCVVTKHTLGIPIFLLSIFYPYKEKKKIKTRLLFGCIPILLFLIYLTFSNTFFEFLDLGILGIFDFQNNREIDLPYCILILIAIFISIYQFLRKKKNITYYYLLIYLLVIYPIIDAYHSSLFLLFFIFVFLYNSDFQINKITKFSCCILFIFIPIIWLVLTKNIMTNLHIYYYPNFPLEIISSNDKKIYDELFHYIKNKKVIFITDAGKNAFLNISTNRNLNYFSILNRGNFGYNGTEKLKNKLMEEKNVYFIIDTGIKCNDKFCQYMVEIPEYIQKKLSFVKKIGKYEVYYHEMK